MPNINRDLLVNFNPVVMSPQDIEHQVTLLHDLLYAVERFDNIITAHELIDLNRYKIFHNPIYIKNWIKRKKNPAFVFLNNIN